MEQLEENNVAKRRDHEDNIRKLKQTEHEAEMERESLEEGLEWGRPCVKKR